MNMNTNENIQSTGSVATTERSSLGRLQALQGEKDQLLATQRELETQLRELQVAEEKEI